MSYTDFIDRKLSRVPPTGLSSIPELPADLFDFQADMMRKGRHGSMRKAA